MRLSVCFEPLAELSRHVAIPSVYESNTVFEVLADSDGYALRERPLAHSFRKDYDLVEDPLSWPRQFDVSNWILVAAFHGTTRVGGALAALNTPGVDLLEGRSDLAVLWDLRVAPGARRRGVASALLAAIEGSARERGCRELKVETQNTNVAACKLYSGHGCTLAQVNFDAYRALPGEVQLIWRRNLDCLRAMNAAYKRA